MIERAFAPAKVNLFLHVGPLGDDGYHPLESWMVFADIGDEITLKVDDPPARRMGFAVDGPFADGVPTDRSNLVVAARDAVLEQFSLRSGFDLTLTKNLPPASGLGGGSSDAAATLRLIGGRYRTTAERLDEIARRLGSDVPACVVAKSLMARGRGEQIGQAPAIPPLPAVLVNPGVPTATGPVFRAYDSDPVRPLEPVGLPDRLEDVAAVAGFLGAQRNDLETPAIVLHPRIGEALSAMRAQSEAMLARMSGSGASCFALCRAPAAADALAARLAQMHPDWWIRACTLS